MSATIVSPGSGWAEVMQRFGAYGLDDVFFDHRYISLYARGERTAEAFLWERDGNTLFFPYVRCPIAGTDFADFETAYGYGGPLATTDDPEFLGRAWEEFNCYAHSQGLIAGLVRFHPLLDTHRFCAIGPIRVHDDRNTVVLKLNQSYDQVWQHYSSDNRRRIRAAVSHGVRVDVRRDNEALEVFSKLYAARMEDLGADEDYRLDDLFFRGIGSLGRDHYAVLLAYDQEVVIGGALLLIWRGLWHYHLSASRKEYFHLGPNNILRDVGIKAALGKGDLLHFGGGRTGDPNDPLLRFKARFSQDRAQYRFGTCCLDEAAYANVCADWALRNPDKVSRYGRYCLRYRY